VLFADAGQILRLGATPGSRVLAGGGAGISFFGGVFRMELSHPITRGGDGLRFDVVFRGIP
jgi:hypothetical protein